MDRAAGTGRRRASGALLTIGAAVLLAGCGAGGGGAATESSNSGSSGGAGDKAPGAASAPVEAGGAASGSTGKPGSTSTTVAQPRAVTDPQAIAYTATTTESVPSPTQAARRVETLVATRQGAVFAQQTSTGTRPDGTADPAQTRVEMTLKVPPAGFRPLLADLAGLDGARVVELDQSAEDVSTQVADVDSRLGVARDGIARIRALVTKATDLDQIVRLETELTRRESDLESLEAQQRVLDARTSLATVVLTLVAPAAVPVTEHAQHRGFLGGLRAGWAAFTAALAVGLTVLGAVLPFAVALALLGALAWWVSRRLPRAPRPYLRRDPPPAPPL